MPSNDLNGGGSPREPAGKPSNVVRLNDAKHPRPRELNPDERLNIREALAMSYGEELLFVDGEEFDDAIVGVGERAGMATSVIYDTQRVVDILVTHHGMNDEEAVEYFYYNIVGAYVGEHTPIFLSTLMEI